MSKPAIQTFWNIRIFHRFELAKEVFRAGFLEQPMMMETPETKQWDASMQGKYSCLFRVQFQPQFARKKIFYFMPPFFKLMLRFVQDNKIIKIAQIVFCPELFLDEVVERVKIDIREYLACQGTKRHSFATCRVFTNYFFQQRNGFFITYFYPYQVKENFMVNRGEIMPYVGFQAESTNHTVVFCVR